MQTLLCRNETIADKEWSKYALKNRHSIQVYQYNNLNKIVYYKCSDDVEYNNGIKLLEHDQAYKNALMKACNNIQVDYPNDNDISYKRDYYLVRDADSLYFSGYFELNKSRLLIKGRENWIVEMFLNKIEKSNPEKLKSLPIYMFSEDLRCWCQLDHNSLKWIYILRAPKPVGKYLAFGSDPISLSAKLEINII
jgi:hypothetical protein